MDAETTVDLPELPAGFSGSLLRPGEPGYDGARLVHNGLIDKRPSLIVRCRTTSDVQAAVALARARSLEISVRGGGHNVAGRAVTDGGVMIDLGDLRSVAIDVPNRRAVVGGGATWAEVNDAAARHELATTGGIVSSTGVAGLTLGGGLGWLMGRYGLAADNLSGAELVTADGVVVHASERAEPDLLWALRGGGGNFGVVTSLELDLHPMGDVLAGSVRFPLDAASGVADVYRATTGGASDELTAGMALARMADGSPVIGVSVCHCGPPGQADAEVAALRSLGAPLADEIRRMPYPDVNTQADAAFPKGALNYWKSAFVRDVSQSLMTVLVDAFRVCPSPMSLVVLEHIHGAAARVPADATAFPHRGEGYSLLIISQWTDPAATTANIQWTRDTYDAVGPFLVDRRYVNYLAADDAAANAEAYGRNLARLRQVKRRYDPDNAFRLNQNIPPE